MTGPTPPRVEHRFPSARALAVVLGALVAAALAGPLGAHEDEHEAPEIVSHAHDVTDIWDIARGGQLYDNWMDVLELDPPPGRHPAYSAAGQKDGAATWRCKECHGWDYGLRGTVAASEDLSIGALVEVQFESNSSAAVNQADNTAVGPNNFTERKLELTFDSARLGRLSLGQGSTASDGSAEADLSGTALAAYSNVAAFAGGLDFTTSATGALSGVTVGAAFSNLDGLGRDDRLRYDTPSYRGFVLSSSLVDGGEWDAALAYGGEFPTLKAVAKIAYANQSATRTFPEDIVSGSLSFLHDGGLNLTLAGGRGDEDDSTREANEFWYGKLGYVRSIFDMGTSHFSLDLGEYNGAAASGDEARTYGVQFVQNISPWSTELYAGYRNYSLDRAGASFDGIDAVLTGVRIKF